MLINTLYGKSVQTLMVALLCSGVGLASCGNWTSSPVSDGNSTQSRTISQPSASDDSSTQTSSISSTVQPRTFISSPPSISPLPISSIPFQFPTDLQAEVKVKNQDDVYTGRIIAWQTDQLWLSSPPYLQNIKFTYIDQISFQAQTQGIVSHDSPDQGFSPRYYYGCSSDDAQCGFDRQEPLSNLHVDVDRKIAQLTLTAPLNEDEQQHIRDVLSSECGGYKIQSLKFSGSSNSAMIVEVIASKCEPPSSEKK